MALLRIVCPECGAGLKSSTGFSPGQTVNCPKCEAYFTVEDPDDRPAPAAKAKAAPAKRPVKAAAPVDDEDEDDDRPRKKKKKRQDDDEEGWSYKNSWIRYVVLGVLLIVLGVLGYLLYEKRKREKEEANAGSEPANTSTDTPQPRIVNPGRGLPDGAGPAPLRPGGPQPGVIGKGPNFKGPNNPTPGPVPGNGPFAGPGAVAGPDIPFLGPPPGVNTPEGQRITGELSRKLAGTWQGTAPDGSAHQVEYRSDGTYTHEVTDGPKPGKTAGQWKPAGLVGTKGLKLDRAGGGRPQVSVVFEDDELIHDTDTPGQSVVLRKK